MRSLLILPIPSNYSLYVPFETRYRAISLLLLCWSTPRESPIRKEKQCIISFWQALLPPDSLFSILKYWSWARSLDSSRRNARLSVRFSEVGRSSFWSLQSKRQELSSYASSVFLVSLLCSTQVKRGAISFPSILPKLLHACFWLTGLPITEHLTSLPS